MTLKSFGKLTTKPRYRTFSPYQTSALSVQSGLVWTGGQPFLTQKVCALLVESQVRIGEGQEKSFIEEFIYSSIIRNWEGQDVPLHLKYIKTRLLSKELLTGKLLEIYRHILQNGYFTTEGNQLESELRLSGLVVKRNADLEIFNPIYREVFSLEWVQKQLDSLRPYAVALNAWLASEKNNAYLLDETETARADIWREGKFLTREDEEFIRDSKLAQKDKDSAQKIEAEREAKKILENAKKKAQKALIGSIIASALIVAGTLIFAIIQTNKAERASQEANQSMQDLINIKKERDKIGQEVIRANDRLSQVSAERRQIELNAKQRLAVAQGNLKRLETARNQAQQQVTQFQRQKTILEQERQIILAQKLEAESRTRKSQGELQEIKGSLQVNRQRLEGVNINLQRAEQAQHVAIKLTQLEQRGINISRRFENGNEGQITLLLEALEVGQELQNVAKPGFKNEYSTPSFLLTLHTIINGIQERNRLVFQAKIITLSPNAQYIVTESKDGAIHLWDLKGNLLTEFKGHQEDIKSVAFSPNGKYLATGAENNTARLWDLKANLLTEFKGHQGYVESVAFSPDGKYLATGSRDDTARLWDLNGNLIAELKGHQNNVVSVNFSPDGKYLATGSKDNTPRLWDLKGNLLTEFKGHQKDEDVESVAFSPNGKYLATGSEDEDDTARVWDLKGNLVKEFKKTKRIVFSPDSKYLVTRSFQAELWDIKRNVITELNGHRRGVIDVSFSPDGKYLATLDYYGAVRLWNLKGKLLLQFKVQFDQGIRLKFSPNGQYLMSIASTGVIDEDNTLFVWDLPKDLITQLSCLKDNERIQPCIASNILIDIAKDCYESTESIAFQAIYCSIHHISSVSFSPNGKYLATGPKISAIAQIWDLQGKLLVNLGKRDLKFGATVADFDASVAFSPDSQYLATSSEDGIARLWNLQGKLLIEFKGHRKNLGIDAIAFSPDGQYLATNAHDNTARLWDLKGNLLTEFKGHQEGVESVAFSPDGQYLATGSFDSTARLWDLKGNLLAQFKGHKYPVISVAFSPNGKYLATGSMDNTARLWDLKGNLLTKFKGHQEGVESVAFSPNGKYLATGSSDNTARLWDLKGNILTEFKGHKNTVESVAFSPDGKYLATGSMDATARLWRVEELDDLLVRGCHWLKDYFVSHPKDLQELPVCQQALKTSR